MEKEQIQVNSTGFLEEVEFSIDVFDLKFILINYIIK